MVTRMNQIYKNALSEVYEILQYLEEESYNKIPKEIIKLIDDNRNKQYDFWIDKTAPLKDQIILEETKEILFEIYRDYLASPEVKEKIIEYQKQEGTI